MPYGHLITATVMTLRVRQGYSSIASFFSILTCASCSPSAIAELLVVRSTFQCFHIGCKSPDMSGDMCPSVKALGHVTRQSLRVPSIVYICSTYVQWRRTMSKCASTCVWTIHALRSTGTFLDTCEATFCTFFKACRSTNRSTFGWKRCSPRCSMEAFTL